MESNINIQSICLSLLLLFQEFGRPHDVVASTDFRNVYVVEIGPNKVWKFERTLGMYQMLCLVSEINYLFIAFALYT